MASKALYALRKNQSGTFTLQITSMIDMFTIILVFLLKSYASSSVTVDVSKDMVLPTSSSSLAPVEALKLMVSRKGISVDDKNVVIFENGEIPKNALNGHDAKFIQPLYDALKVQAEKTKGIAKQNESVNFEGKIIFQADQGLNYELLKKVMYTSSFAGYTDFKFAVVAN